MGFVDNNDCAAEILMMMVHGGREGKELLGRGDNHATREDNKMAMKATPQSLGK